ncbi:DegV family protein [Clostridium hominis]|uniref:DegV family protein n=1 Tax=Clostridium hominis TaxID=2763036 RepID=UPI000A7F49A5|nr:DegV family protein [Clostridium hominis]MDU2671767.1 DegV family protein [Clostridium sp.]
MIKLIVDSICDLPEEIFEKYDVEVLPLRVLINDKEYLDRENITIDEVYAEMRKGVLPRTSQVSPGNIYEIFDKNCEEGNDFIYLAFSSVLSGTCNLAKKIAEEFKEKYPERNIEVVDTKAGAIGIGVIAMQVLKLIESGVGFEKIIEDTYEMVGSIEHLFILEDLNWLMKGGRINKVQATLGTMLDLKPMLQVNNGYLEVIKKVRGKKKSINMLLDLVEERMNGFTDQIIGIGHADDEDIAKEVVKAIKERFGEDAKCVITKIGCVLGAHLGIGGVGVIFFNKKFDFYEQW